MLSPKSGCGDAWRSWIAVVVFGIYPIYNLIKRIYYCSDAFARSSFFANIADFILGLVVGYVLGLAAHMLTDKGNERFILDGASSIVIVAVATCVVAASALFYFKSRTTGVNECTYKK